MSIRSCRMFKIKTDFYELLIHTNTEQVYTKEGHKCHWKRNVFEV